MFLNVKAEAFDVLRGANLRVEMSWCRTSVVRLTQVMACKALKAQNKWISFLSLKHAVVNFFPTSVRATTFFESSHGKTLRVGMP